MLSGTRAWFHSVHSCLTIFTVNFVRGWHVTFNNHLALWRCHHSFLFWMFTELFLFFVFCKTARRQWSFFFFFLNRTGRKAGTCLINYLNVKFDKALRWFRFISVVLSLLCAFLTVIPSTTKLNKRQLKLLANPPPPLLVYSKHILCFD